MDSTVIVALVGILAASLVGPMALSQLSARQRRAERVEDYARQDAVARAAQDREDRQEVAAKEVADQAKQAAVLLLAAQKESIDRTDEVARLAADAQGHTDAKLNQIHQLVNSTLTGAMQSQLVAMEAQLVMMRHYEPESSSEIATLAVDVAELHAKLADRAKQTEIADAKVK